MMMLFVYLKFTEMMRKHMMFSNNVSRISPAWIYYNASSILAGTDSNVYTRFMDQARRYRQELISYSRSQRGFTSLSFFTRMTMDETLDYAKLAELESKQGHRAIDDLFEKYTQKFWNSPPLQGVPTFQYKPESLSESIRRTLPDILILALLNVFFFLTAYASFMRQEVK